jgi:hypothetical protein
MYSKRLKMRGGKLDAEKKKKKKGQRDCQCAGGGSGYALTRLPTVVPLLICGPAPVENKKKRWTLHTHTHTHLYCYDMKFYPTPFVMRISGLVCISS